MVDPLKSICEDPLERKWVWISLVLAIVMGGMLGYYAVASNIHPPSNVETIDSSRLHLTEEFAEDNLGVKTNDRELMTYGLWSRLCWAQYLVPEADRGNAKEPDHET